MAPAERGDAAESRGGPAPATIDVELVYSPGPRQVVRIALRVAAGSTVAAALGQAAHQVPAEASSWTLALWGRRAAGDEPLEAGDRIELLRPLRLDPMQARRLRQQRQLEAEASGRRPGTRPRIRIDGGPA